MPWPKGHGIKGKTFPLQITLYGRCVHIILLYQQGVGGQEKTAPLCLNDISSMRNALPSHFKLIIIIDMLFKIYLVDLTPLQLTTPMETRLGSFLDYKIIR